MDSQLGPCIPRQTYTHGDVHESTCPYSNAHTMIPLQWGPYNGVVNETQDNID
jgi:hypothetical protein